jgi:methenyltetrahydrofolate cyclohydrolase
MKKFKNHSLEKYLDVLAAREPVPGGGSAAAMAAALGAGLISMVTQYSLKKGSPALVERRLQKTLLASERLRQRFLRIVDLDAEAYLAVVRTRKGPERARKAALKQAAKVPRELAQLCYQAIDLTPFLVLKGNKYLFSDVEVAVELLLAAFKSAMTMSQQG